MRRRDLIADLQDAPVTPLALAAAAVLVVLAASSAGYPVTAWGPGGLVVLGLLVLALLLLPHQLQALPRPTLIAGGLLGAYVLWSYASILWADDQGAAWLGANRTLAYLRALFNWAVKRGRLPSSPVLGVDAPSKERTRDRVLSDDELRWLWRACEKIDWPFGPLVKLLLLTGQRRDEVATLRWSELDLG